LNQKRNINLPAAPYYQDICSKQLQQMKIYVVYGPTGTFFLKTYFASFKSRDVAKAKRGS